MHEYRINLERVLFSSGGFDPLMTIEKKNKKKERNYLIQMSRHSTMLIRKRKQKE